jgi:hypothetical protein
MPSQHQEKIGEAQFVKQSRLDVNAMVGVEVEEIQREFFLFVHSMPPF